MTTSSPNITFDNTSTATFRAWGLAISTALAAVGLVKTGDSGQIDWTTVTQPGAGNVMAGYEIWRLNDGLQATRPVFMKIEYGNGPSVSNPSIVITYGTGTNGAGTITSLLISGRHVLYGAGSTTVQPCYFASDGSYLTMLLAPALHISNPVAQFFAVVLFDRSRDGSNAITNEGFHFIDTHPRGGGVSASYGAIPFSNSNFGGTTNFRHGIFAFKINSRGEVGEQTSGNFYTGSAFFQIPLGPGSANYLGDIAYFPQLVTCPNVVYSSLALVGFTGDLPAALTQMTVPVLGATRTYIVIGLDFSGLGTSTIRSLVRFE